ncbi:PTS sugar transporter subunit IIA [Fictibacillus enclensis]|uniref:PTS sugar transporter subunit IIA n=1 Tax=Fictibacillus enclensis TaxID=1017270 RepID=UPI0025A01A74|nr:PTS sugar transporter subunit IIA [Fictibacillus enclensis]MDM5338480.1 PTS sugar transporter subunit IIA [Fictibacillus enclensis]
MIEPKHIILDAEAASAADAIHTAGNLLVVSGLAEPRYVEAMIQGFTDVGPYIVLAPGIAVPHARPEHGVNQTGMSFVRLKEEVVFGHPGNDPVRLVCAICGTDNISHIGLLQQLSGVLGNPNKLNALYRATTKEEVALILKGEDE